MKFQAGDLLLQLLYGGKKYYFFIEEVTASKYKGCHTFVFENEKCIMYTKNAGHGGWISSDKIDDEFAKVGTIPALINVQNIVIDK